MGFGGEHFGFGLTLMSSHNANMYITLSLICQNNQSKKARGAEGEDYEGVVDKNQVRAFWGIMYI